MEKEAKGFSLRQKKSSRRPQISAPRQISRPRQFLDGAEEGPPKRPNAHGDASDLVKRRYSTRFNQLPDFSNAGAPPVPSLPAPQRRSRGPSPSAPKVNIDVNVLRDPNLVADQYSNHVLTDATDQDLRDFQSNLRRIKNRASTDLQQNVYQNRTQFVAISKEAGKLKGEMGTLRGLISELMASLGSAAISASIPEPRHLDQSSVAQARKAANRSSVANLDAIWNAQLFTLWKKVEGSQKYLPALPGRHIKHESGHWVELNAATWRPRRHVHMILLNDHLLIATWKKRRVDSSVISSDTAQGSSKLVADKCFALQDIDIFDLASSTIANDMGKSGRSEMANAISVRIGGDSYTYRSDKAAETDKAELLLTFRRAADELSRISRAEAEEASSRSRGDLDPPVTNGSVAAKSPSTPRLKDYPEILVEVDGKHQNMRWVEGQIDELDSAIALQQFERAVQHVEKLQGVAKGLKSNVVAQKTMVTRIDDRATKIADLVVKRLIGSSQHLTYTQSNIAWLVRLGFDERAREAYLSSRSTTVSQRTRLCIFEGDLHHYVFQLSYVYFTLIKHTFTIYQQCFPQLMMSACVTWAKKHLDHFNTVLLRQLSSVQKDSSTWHECMERAKEHARMLDEVGLDFSELIGVEEKFSIREISDS